MKIIAIVQARMGSVRFPNKVMRPICGTPMIGLLLRRLARARLVDQIVVATSEDPRNEPLVRYVRELGYGAYQGSENDVLDRYYQVATEAKADAIVRVTGDCPLIDAEIVDELIERFRASGVDYASNVEPPSYPDGLDTEVFTYAALKRAWEVATGVLEREHVTPYIREAGRFSQ